MTREEVIQSLRVCINAITSISECEKCSFRNEGNGERCLFTMMRSAADMLEADEQQLEVAVSSMQGVLGGLKEINQALDNATDNNVGAKTADDMFRELGYERLPWSDCHEDGFVAYENRSAGLHIDIAASGNSIKFLGNCMYSYSPAELRAVCKLLDEMGVE